MKAAVIHALGQPPRCEDFPEPTAGEGEVGVNVRAAALHPVVRARVSAASSGSANASPVIPGWDGVGYLDDGTRVYFALARPLYGTMAERSVVPREMTFPLPDRLDDLTAAAIFNPAQASWLALTQAQLAQGDTVLILGATGVAGKLAVQIAKRLGAGRVVALGRNAQALSELPRLGADATISLDQPDQELIEAIVNATSTTGIHVILDFLWGRPTEAVIAALTHQGTPQGVRSVHLTDIGQMAGPTITLPASVLRNAALVISGSGLGAPRSSASGSCCPGSSQRQPVARCALRPSRSRLPRSKRRGNARRRTTADSSFSRNAHTGLRSRLRSVINLLVPDCEKRCALEARAEGASRGREVWTSVAW